MDRNKLGERIRWICTGILLALALVAQLLGRSPAAVVTPLLLAMILGCYNLAQNTEQKQTGRQSGR
ncbi:hypothetical protein [Streptomyces sp. NPDC048442]|uniref:hypothetical protein n=1 Tax=Streptomyces sp. NPDC048442 TaxID=3154823 RepID=UPI00343D092F